MCVCVRVYVCSLTWTPAPDRVELDAPPLDCLCDPQYHFISVNPPDTELSPVSRTVGEDQLVDEMVFKCTHTVEMDWLLPGVAPTGKRCVRVSCVVRMQRLGVSCVCCMTPEERALHWSHGCLCSGPLGPPWFVAGSRSRWWPS